MKPVKMKIAGITLNDGIANPLVVLKSKEGKPFPVPMEDLDKKVLLNSIITKKSIHSELVLKILTVSDIEIKSIVLDKSETSRLIAKVFISHGKKTSVELSAAAGILLCLETGLDISINPELFNDASFFKNRIDEKNILENLDRFFIHESDLQNNSKTLNSVKEIIQ